jgi:hypothetical protein
MIIGGIKTSEEFKDLKDKSLFSQSNILAQVCGCFMHWIKMTFKYPGVYNYSKR